MIHWGIIGAGNIANRFSSSLENEKDSELTAISGRNKEKLEAFAEKHPCRKIYIGHENLLADPEIDAVYLALPHVMHHEWAVKALKAGKAVLCEKPAVLNREEMEDIARVSKETGVLFMEAMKSRFEPAYKEVKQLLKDHQPYEISASVTFNMPPEANGKSYHTMPKGGGCLLDSGVYCAAILEDFFEGDPELIKTEAIYYNGIDTYVKAWLKFDNGIGILETAFDRAYPKTAQFKTDGFTIGMPDPHRPHSYAVTDDSGTKEINAPYEYDDFYPQIHHFVQLLEEGKKESDIMPLAASVRCAAIMDEVRRGFTEYTEEDLRQVEKQEELCRYGKFTGEEALELGNIIAELAKEYDRPVSIEIKRVKDNMVIFRYMMDGKTERNIGFMTMKEQALIDSGHSSGWCGLHYLMDGTFAEWMNDGIHAISGGAVGIYTEEGLTAIAAVSGLHEGKDHELIIRGICRQLGIEEYPVVRKAMI